MNMIKEWEETEYRDFMEMLDHREETFKKTWEAKKKKWGILNKGESK